MFKIFLIAIIIFLGGCATNQLNNDINITSNKLSLGNDSNKTDHNTSSLGNDSNKTDHNTSSLGNDSNKTKKFKSLISNQNIPFMLEVDLIETEDNTFVLEGTDKEVENPIFSYDDEIDLKQEEPKRKEVKKVVPKKNTQSKKPKGKKEEPKKVVPKKNTQSKKPKEKKEEPKKVVPKKLIVVENSHIFVDKSISKKVSSKIKSYYNASSKLILIESDGSITVENKKLQQLSYSGNESSFLPFKYFSGLNRTLKKYKEVKEIILFTAKEGLSKPVYTSLGFLSFKNRGINIRVFTIKENISIWKKYVNNVQKL